jgi:hypothetical protein
MHQIVLFRGTKSSIALTWYAGSGSIQKSWIRCCCGFGNRTRRQHIGTSPTTISSTMFCVLYHCFCVCVPYKWSLCLGKYCHPPHNDVLVNNTSHIGRWSHNIIILEYYIIVLWYNIIILTIVLQLPVVFSTVTCCTGL